ncbi:hypothetical protein Taro_024658 [Colocasia esculenta]|uniref:Uncharacterized protein n=1 Tax=Colocasia esculenta TaxID=4460 RepID=A0A843VL07_COLES|nr:hypothetical protein [Colocasia esculenta]
MPFKPWTDLFKAPESTGDRRWEFLLLGSSETMKSLISKILKNSRGSETMTKQLWNMWLVYILLSSHFRHSLRLTGHHLQIIFTLKIMMIGLRNWLSYPWKAKRCSSCSSFGHSDVQCKQGLIIRKEYRSKPVQKESQANEVETNITANNSFVVLSQINEQVMVEEIPGGDASPVLVPSPAMIAPVVTEENPVGRKESMDVDVNITIGWWRVNVANKVAKALVTSSCIQVSRAHVVRRNEGNTKSTVLHDLPREADSKRNNSFTHIGYATPAHAAQSTEAAPHRTQHRAQETRERGRVIVLRLFRIVYTCFSNP